MKFRLLYILCLAALPALSQIFSFKTLTEDDGLSQSFINDLNQDHKGLLYIATGNGLTTFDGIKFKVFNSTHGLTNDFITTTYFDHENKMWLGHSEGGVSVIYGNGVKQKIEFKEEISSKIIQIIEVSTNNYVFLKNNTGLILYNEGTKAYTNIEDEAFNEVLAVMVIKEDLLLLKANGIYSIKIKELLNKKYTVTLKRSLMDAALMKHGRSTESIIIADNTVGILVLSNDGKFTPLDTFKITKNDGSFYTKLVYDRFSNIYAATTDNGIYKINTKTGTRFNYTVKNGLNSNAVQSIYIDREDNLWIGTYGSGLQLLYNEIYSYDFISDQGQKLAINASVKIQDKLILASNKGIGYFNDGQLQFVKHPLLLNKNINCLMRYKNILLFSTSEGELFQSDTLFNKITKIPIKTTNQKLAINSLSYNEEAIFACSSSGLYIINPADHSYTLLNTESGLLHNNVKFVFEDSKKRLWVCSPGTLIYYLVNLKDVVKFNEVPGLKNFSTNGVCEDPEHNVWISTIGDGVFKYDGRTFENYNITNGLKSNFCYGVTSDYKNGIWVSHSNGISYKNQNKKNFNKIDGRSELLQTFFIENSLYYDNRDNEVIFGTTDGIARINTTKQKFNEVEPALSISGICLNDTCVSAFSDTILGYDSYDLTIDFIGVCLKDPTKVKYKYKLEGLTDNWEEISYETRRVNFPKLKDGEYTFLLYASNNDGLWNSVPVKFRFTIKKPFWKEIWFLFALCLFIVILFIVLIRRRTKALIRRQKILENIIDQKTEEIKAEKELIAKINENLNIVLKDLKDSINYAKKIQSFILPDLDHIQKNLKTFLYFEPKDVVSGDYYGFYNVNKNYTIVFLIDCTGHGVPGAFLTVISKAFLNKIIIDKEIYEPDAIIENLNFELRSFFDSNPNVTEKNFEGLVISLCCINYPEKTVEFCGAGRPILYKIHNDLVFQRGNILSVGYDEDLPSLEVVKIPFNQGLRVYLMSDGMQDQFGGPNAKKFSSKRIMDNLERSHDLPFEQECQAVIDEFKEWKKDSPQVDDICFFAFELFSSS